MVEFREATRGTGRGLYVEGWIWANVKGDVWALVAHFVFWFAWLTAIETGVAAKMKQLYSCCCKFRFPEPIPDLDIDEEVLNEERRVTQSAEQF